MKATIIGIGQRRSGTGKTSGKPYDITPIYCTCTARNVIGEKCEEITFNHLAENLELPTIQVGDIVQISHDKHGFLEEITLVEAAGKAKT